MASLVPRSEDSVVGAGVEMASLAREWIWFRRWRSEDEMADGFDDVFTERG